MHITMSLTPQQKLTLFYKSTAICASEACNLTIQNLGVDRLLELGANFSKARAARLTASQLHDAGVDSLVNLKKFGMKVEDLDDKFFVESMLLLYDANEICDVFVSTVKDVLVLAHIDHRTMLADSKDLLYLCIKRSGTLNERFELLQALEKHEMLVLSLDDLIYSGLSFQKILESAQISVQEFFELYKPDKKSIQLLKIQDYVNDKLLFK